MIFLTIPLSFIEIASILIDTELLLNEKLFFNRNLLY